MAFYRDELGLLTQANGDAGDCCNETGVYYAGLWLLKHRLKRDISMFPDSDVKGFLNALFHLEVKPGIYVRHPKQFPDPFDPNWGASRDQISPIAIALALWGKTDPLFKNYLERLRNAHEGRSRKIPFLWQYQNADVAGPEQLNIYKRGLDGVASTLGDVQLFGSALVRAVNPDPDNVGDDRIHSMSLILAKEIAPTSWSHGAFELYRTNRRENHGNTPLLGVNRQESPILGAWAWYYRQGTGNITEMFTDIWQPVLQHYFGGK